MDVKIHGNPPDYMSGATEISHFSLAQIHG